MPSWPCGGCRPLVEIHGVGGSVTADDGSGNIEVEDVEKDLIIENDGSGRLTYNDIRGVVQRDTWAGVTRCQYRMRQAAI